MERECLFRRAQSSRVISVLMDDKRLVPKSMCGAAFFKVGGTGTSKTTVEKLSGLNWQL